MSETITDHELQELKKMSKPHTPEQSHTTLSLVNIARIVTTIESQKEALFKADEDHAKFVDVAYDTIKKHEKQIESLKAITEEQNEKLKNLDYLVDELNKSNKAINNMLDRAQIKNKSLEAITELAVKGFQMLKAMSSKEDIPAALYNTASWYLDEIANLEVKR